MPELRQANGVDVDLTQGKLNSSFRIQWIDIMGKGLELKAGECVLAVCHPGIGWAWKGGTDLESHVNARRGILWRPFSTLNRPRCLRFQSLKIPGRIQMNAARNTSEDTLSGSWNAKERQMPHLDSLSTCPWFLHASPERAAV